MNPISSSAELLNSVGVNTHLNYADTPYGNYPLVIEQIRALGVKNIRDGAHGYPNLDWWSVLCEPFQELVKMGVRINCVIDPFEKLGPTTSDLLFTLYNGYAQGVLTWEGMNEPDVSVDGDWVSTAKAWQQTLYVASTLPQAIGKMEVLACALAQANPNAAKLGVISAMCDYGNLHPYPAGQMPEPVIRVQLQLAEMMTPGLLTMVTETGYFTGPANDYSSGQPGVSELAAAKYILRLLLDNFSCQIPRTWIYELLEQKSDDYWGLIRYQGKAKTQFKAISNFLHLLGGPNCSLTPIDLTIDAPEIPKVRTLLVQKAHATWILFLWQEVSCYDTAAGRDQTNSLARVTVGLPSACRCSLHLPLEQREPYEIGTATSLLVQVPDHPIAVEIAY